MPPDNFLFQVEFYTGPGGDEPVQSDLKRLNRSNRALAVHIRAALERIVDPRYHGPPQTKALGEGLFEVRPGAARILFFHADARRLVIVHVFVKTSQKTPKRELSTARERMKLWKQMHYDNSPGGPR